MTKLQIDAAVVQQMLDALEVHVPYYVKDRGYLPIDALRAALQQAEPLCEDEGCPHHGTPHVCVNDFEQQAQAGEPDYWHAECDDPDYSAFFPDKADAMARVSDHGGTVTPYINYEKSLQSHREAMAKAEEKYQTLLVHLMDVYAEFGANWGDNIFLSITQHTAKKDEALKACVNANKKLVLEIEWWEGEHSCCKGRSDDILKENESAISQAKEAMK